MFQSYLSHRMSNNLVAGELFVLGADQASQLCITGARDPAQPRASYFTLQQLNRVPAFAFATELHPQSVASFGSDWILEPADYVGVHVGNRWLTEAPGLVRIRAGRNVIQGRSPLGFEEEFHFDLSTGEIVDRQYQETIPVFKWQLWANAQHRNTQGAQPLMTFEAAPPIANQD